MTLLNLLETYTKSGALPMHMPGHKRNTALAPYLQTLGAALDITEIPGFSNLHDPEGALAERMRDAAALWGSRRAWWLVGGSTAGLLAAIDAATKPDDRVLMARSCHKSVYNACMLSRTRTAYLQPALFENHDFPAPITAQQVESALTAYPDTRLVVVTSPTYEGLIGDIAEISRVVHEHGALLLVDEAHGAHLGMEGFPPSAVTQGADLVVQSLHKTLPCLTQTAILHLCSDRVSEEELGFRLSVYQTSSPSYLLMASIDGCVRLLQEQGGALSAAWRQRLDAFHSRTASLGHLTLPLRGLQNADPSKLLISTAGTDLTGPALAQRLREGYAIETEMSTAATVLAMTGMGDTDEGLLRLADALLDIDRTLTCRPATMPMPLPVPKAALPIYEAAKVSAELVPWTEAEGRIAADFLWAYPPGIPLIVPGEVIDRPLMDYVRRCDDCGVELHSPKGAPDGHIRVLKKG